MCQAYEGERNYLLSRDRFIREKGFDAQKNGVPRDENPMDDHPNPYYSDKRQWWAGWDTAKAGKEVW